MDADIRVAYASRYLEAVGITAMVYDHLLTFPDEVAYIWAAPKSLSKYCCLVNRYLVLCMLIALSVEMCGFVGNILDDTGCQRFLFVFPVIAVFSLGFANFLVLSRVVILWEHRPVIYRIMFIGFAVSFSAQVFSLLVTLLDVISTVQWSPVVRMCIVSKSSPVYIAVWASPMIFEVLVLLMTFLNSLDKPRSAQMPLHRTLHRDGIGYFVAISALRVFNITIAALQKPAYMLLTVFFVWAMTTTILNRLIINRQREERQDRLLSQQNMALPLSSLSYFSRAKTVSPTSMFSSNHIL